VVHEVDVPFRAGDIAAVSVSSGSDGEGGVPPGASSAAMDERANALVGQVVADRYRIHNVLATGGMGVVYTGEHVHMRKRVAIKVLHPDTEGLPGLVARFEREAIVGAHVEHKNVASARDFGRMEDGSHYLVLEFVRGVTLRQILRHGRMPIVRAVRIAKQIATALSKIHAKGIYHRDVNPRNVMVIPGPKDLVKVIDFGFAKVPVEKFNAMSFQKGTPTAPSQITGDGVIFGTIGFLAPEAALGMRHVDHRSDLYALGAMLYEMLSGEPPFEADTQAGLFLKHRMEPVPTMAERGAPEVPAALEAVAQKLLAKEPADRYQRAEDVIRALDEANPSAMPEAERAQEIEPEPISLSVAGAAPPRSLPRFEDVADGTPEPSVTEERSPPGIEAPPRSVSPRSAAPVAPKRGSSWLLLAGSVVLLGAAGLVAFRSGLIGKPDAPDIPTAKLDASAASSVRADPTPPTPATAKSSAAATAVSAPAPTATAINGLDAEAWKKIVRQAPTSRDFAKANEGLKALAELDPGALATVELRLAAVEIVVAAGGDRAQTAVLVKLLAERFGGGGVDVLYDLVATRGGSQAATLATPFLQNPEVRGRGTPALRIALELRDAACADKAALMERVRADGDERSLAILSAIRSPDCDASAGSCCMRENPAIETAARELAERLTKK
jgi:serine/threonine-protein kinase